MPLRGEKQHFIFEAVSTAYKAAHEIQGGTEIPNGSSSSSSSSSV
jgi:hypothetical protein